MSVQQSINKKAYMLIKSLFSFLDEYIYWHENLAFPFHPFN